MDSTNQNISLEQVLNKMLKLRHKRIPGHLLFIPFVKECIKSGHTKKEVESFLNNLYKEDKIIIGKSINDKTIKLKIQ